jgi:hypothetical protein
MTLLVLIGNLKGNPSCPYNKDGSPVPIGTVVPALAGDVLTLNVISPAHIRGVCHPSFGIRFSTRHRKVTYRSRIESAIRFPKAGLEAPILSHQYRTSPGT